MVRYWKILEVLDPLNCRLLNLSIHSATGFGFTLGQDGKKENLARCSFPSERACASRPRDSRRHDHYGSFFSLTCLLSLDSTVVSNQWPHAKISQPPQDEHDNDTGEKQNIQQATNTIIYYHVMWPRKMTPVVNSEHLQSVLQGTEILLVGWCIISQETNNSLLITSAFDYDAALKSYSHQCLELEARRNTPVRHDMN